MKKITMLFLLIGMWAACAPSQKQTREIPSQNSVITPGNLGTSFKNAILIKETGEDAGVKAEYDWLKKNYPGYGLESQALVFQKGIPYDVLTIRTQDGIVRKTYFDISRFYGKF